MCPISHLSQTPVLKILLHTSMIKLLQNVFLAILATKNINNYCMKFCTNIHSLQMIDPNVDVNADPLTFR